MWTPFWQGWLFWPACSSNDDNLTQKDGSTDFWVLFLFLFLFFSFCIIIVLKKNPKQPTKKPQQPACPHNESWGQMFSHLKNMYKKAHVYTEKAVAGWWDTYARNQHTYAKGNLYEAPTKAQISGHRQNCAFFLHNSNLFMNMFIFLLISTFYLYTKISGHCLGKMRLILFKFLLFCLFFPVRKSTHLCLQIS